MGYTVTERKAMDKQEPEANQKHYPLSDTETGKKLSQTVEDKTGFDPVDLLESPTKPPELKNTRRSYSALQFFLVMLGAIIATIGLIIWIMLLHGGLGFIVMAVGAACVVIGTLVRV